DGRRARRARVIESGEGTGRGRSHADRAALRPHPLALQGGTAASHPEEGRQAEEGRGGGEARPDKDRSACGTGGLTMPGPPLVLADVNRSEQFLLLGRSRRLFGGYTLHTDGDGVAWATKRVGGQLFAFTWLGPGWVFDPLAQER